MTIHESQDRKRKMRAVPDWSDSLKSSWSRPMMYMFQNAISGWSWVLIWRVERRNWAGTYRCVDSVVLVGHSLGGSTLLKYLSEEEISTEIRRFSSSLPRVGTRWGLAKSGLRTTVRFRTKAARYQHIGLFHSKGDNIVPLKHLNHYRAVLDTDEVHVADGDSHLFAEDWQHL